LLEVDTNIAGRLLAALSNSREDVPHPTTWKGLTGPLLKAAGVRSFDAFAKPAKGVDISQDESGVVLIPTKNGGPRNAFLHLTDRALKSDTSDTSLTSALRAAFDACE
jgi:hypothetical protein